MRPALALAGDAARGQPVFAELCARCHRMGNEGGDLGPNLTEVYRKSRETLLHDILDPNAAVDTAYVSYTIERNNGEIVTGLIAEETDDAVTIRDANGVRTIVPPSSGTMDIYGASWSPDGSRVAYGMFDQTVDAISTRTHIVNADGTGDLLVDTHPDSIADGGFAWSNDGTRLVITRFYSDDGSIPTRSAIVPVDRSSVGIEIACPPKAPVGDCSAAWLWSPDDTQLIGTFERLTGQFLADPSTGDLRAAPWTGSGRPAWQRLAE